MSGSNLHLAHFQEGSYTFNLSKGEDEASEGLDYSRFMHNGLPDFLRIPLGKDQSSLLTFPSMHSKIRALPSTEDAGVGFGGATRVVLDEFEYHKYAEKNFSEIYSVVERGGQLVVLSTADKLRIGTKFKELFRAARAGDNNFFPVFFPYDVLPDRTQQWYDSLDLSASEKECRFPRNEKEALETLKTRAFFDAVALEDMYADCTLKPIGTEHEDAPDNKILQNATALSQKYKGLVRIFRLPAVGRKYCGFTDPSDGKEDPHATIFLDGVTGEQVAESHGKVPADECAEIHDLLVRLYNNAYNSYELNARAGGIFSEKIKLLNTPNQAPFLKTDGSPEKKKAKAQADTQKTGWWTGKNLKAKYIWGLEEAVRLRQVILHSKECVNELSQFMQPEGEEPRAPRGGHDDYIMALGAAWTLKKTMPGGEFKIISLAPKVGR